MLSKKCELCGKEFFKKTNLSYDYFKNKARFCSKECAYSHRKIKINCIICERERMIRASQLNRIKTCSKECSILYRVKRFSDKNREKFSKAWNKKGNPRWKPIGAKRSDGHGYILVKIAEGKGFKNWRQEHVHTIEKDIGRILDLKKECVHHVDGNKENNNIENLYLTTQSSHKKLHQSIFMDLVKELLEKKMIYFDKKNGFYKVIK